jgi:hypothetical protein
LRFWNWSKGPAPDAGVMACFDPWWPRLNLESGGGQTNWLIRIYKFQASIHAEPGAAMSKPSITVIPPIRRQAADALRRARKLPIGHARNDLRQLAIGLLWLEKRGFVGSVEDRDTALNLVRETRV